METPLVVSVEDARKMLALSTTGLYRAISTGELASFKRGRRRYFTRDALHAYVGKESGLQMPKRMGVTHGR